MRKIAVLFDFTDTVNISLTHAIQLADENSEIYLVHVTNDLSPEKQAELDQEITGYAKIFADKNIPFHIKFGSGNLFNAAQRIIQDIQPELVIAGTHGVHGIKQSLFGSSIHKIVQMLPAPTLVVSDKTSAPELGYKNILFPVSPHEDFMVKVEQTIRVLAPGGKVIIFAIMKPGVGLDDQIQSNIKQAEEYFTENNIDYEYKEVPADQFSVGFSRQTIKFAKEQNMDLIAIMAKVSQTNSHFGKMDKENELLNDEGIPILCTNA